MIKEFEVEMAARAKEAAEQSYQLNEKLFAENGATAIIDFFKSFEPQPE